MAVELTIAEIAAERKIIRREWTKLTAKLATLIERNEQLDEMERAIAGEQEDPCAT